MCWSAAPSMVALPHPPESAPGRSAAHDDQTHRESGGDGGGVVLSLGAFALLLDSDEGAARVEHGLEVVGDRPVERGLGVACVRPILVRAALDIPVPRCRAVVSQCSP